MSKEKIGLEEDIFNPAGLPAREQVSEWYPIKEKVGNKVSGIFMGWWANSSNKPGFKDQLGIAIKTSTGTVVGVSLADTSYMRSRIEPSQVGDRCGLKFEGEKDTGKPQKAKIIKFYNPDLEERRAKGEIKISTPDALNSHTEVEDDGLEPF